MHMDLFPRKNQTHEKYDFHPRSDDINIHSLLIRYFGAQHNSVQPITLYQLSSTVESSYKKM